MRNLALSGMLLFLAFFIAKGQENAIIRGRIYDGQRSSPLSGAHIQISETGTSAQSNASGYFEIGNITPGTVRVQFSHIGFQSDSVTLELIPGETVTLNRTLFTTRIDLQQVEITAMRKRKVLDDVPFRVEVITEQDIESAPHISADELLDMVPGINAERNYGIFNKAGNLSMRGLNRNVYTLLLLDGVPLNLLDGGSSNWNRIDPDQIERIEIVKGAHGMLYGSNAVGGVVNLITKKPKEAISGRIKLHCGTYETIGASGNISGRSGKKEKKYFYGHAGGFMRQSAGYIMQPDSLLDFTDDKLYLSEYNTTAKAGYAFSEKALTEAEYRYAFDLRGSGKTIFEPGGNYNKYHVHQVRARYIRTGERSQILADVFWKRENHIRQFEKLSYTGIYTFYHSYTLTSDQGLWLSWTGNLPLNQELTLGADIKSGSSESRDIYHTSTDSVEYAGNMEFYGFFVNDQFSLFRDKITIAAGIRFDAVNFRKGYFDVKSASLVSEQLLPFAGITPDTLWYALSPKISLHWNIDENKKLYAGWSRGFRPGTLSDLCRTGDVSKGFKVANPNLSPETVDHFEVGAVVSLARQVSIEPTVFYMIGHNFQYFMGTGDSIDTLNGAYKPIIRRENIGEVHIYGFEIKAAWVINSHVDLQVNYAYNHSRISRFTIGSYYGEDLRGRALTDVPASSVYGRLVWRNRFLNMALTIEYTGARWWDEENTWRSRPYTVMDIKVYRHFMKRMSFAVTIQNLFDKRFTDSRGYLSPGRFVLGELQVEF